ncbi:hypothetical protein RJ641_027176 [Dillenia turbinata]|uniref:Uncharacterized protein n=1 Tax=Dillenia turbinata TaxID=194707 RepID=A0AAN8VWZ5_9MAGN
MADPISRGHLIAMPYPGRGHINPMMNLCTLLASKELIITFVLTEEWLGLIDSRPKAPNIRLLSIPNVLPSETNRAADFGSFIDAVYAKMEAPFRQLLKELDLPPTCILSDFFLPWMPSVGNQLNIPVVVLWTMAPSLFSIHFHHDMLVARNHSPVVDRSAAMRAQAVVFTSFHDLQPQVIKVMERKLLPMPIYTVGPSIPYTDNRARLGNKNTVGREEIARGVKRVMDLNDSQGKEIRRIALELQESCHRAVQAGGSTPNNIAAFARKFIQGSTMRTGENTSES